MSTKHPSSLPLVVVIFGCLCGGLVCLSAGGLVAFSIFGGATPTPDATGPAVFANIEPPSQAALETDRLLNNTNVPESDLRALAGQLRGTGAIPLSSDAPAPSYRLGEQKTFWASNTDTNKNFEVNTRLQSATEHAYYWIEEGVQYRESDLQALADTFENKIYPTDRKFFGSEWTPGIDNDPHLYIIFARGLGSHLAGYFSSKDSVSHLAHKYSNEHESFFMNADNVAVGKDAYGTLAHEFQHMIHWYRDRNESSWLNEGFSVLAEYLNNFDTGGFDSLYVSQPDIQLTDWPNDPDATTPHYGASFLFLAYYLDRFGEKATQALVVNPENGMESVDLVLKDLGFKDGVTGKQITAEDVFADWVVALFLKDGKVNDGRYILRNYADSPQPDETERKTVCPFSWQERRVNQYGVDYIRIKCKGNYSLMFEGDTEVDVLPSSAHSGEFAFWSNKGDESDMTLTRTFDFTGVSEPLELSYWTWYDLEKDYDYVYLESSTDNGQTWDIIKTPSGTDNDPSGNSYGWGYNGSTKVWKQEKVDISKFSGQKVQLRFQYVTDAAVNGEGFLLDDIQIPATHYQTDFEKDDGGWKSDGFLRLQNRLPQTFRVEIIREGKTTTVENVELNNLQQANYPLNLGGDVSSAVLVVSGTTRFTRQEASYHYAIQQAP